MRQSNQKSRSRGRSRKPQSNMSRNFESNGPDVKIRGNAAHIAEKYTTLARDCLSNGDRVIAENYLQHAEHYNRIVAAAQQQADERAAEMAARNPQPDVDNNQNANAGSQNDSAGDGVVAKTNGASETSDTNVEADAAPKERKNTRTRRPRKPVVEVSTSTTDAPTKSEEPTVNVEAISDDAAKLPGSLLGGMAAEEG